MWPSPPFCAYPASSQGQLLWEKHPIQWADLIPSPHSLSTLCNLEPSIPLALFINIPPCGLRHIMFLEQCYQFWAFESQQSFSHGQNLWGLLSKIQPGFHLLILHLWNFDLLLEDNCKFECSPTMAANWAPLVMVVTNDSGCIQECGTVSATCSFIFWNFAEGISHHIQDIEALTFNIVHLLHLHHENLKCIFRTCTSNFQTHFWIIQGITFGPKAKQLKFYPTTAFFSFDKDLVNASLQCVSGTHPPNTNNPTRYEEKVSSFCLTIHHITIQPYFDGIFCNKNPNWSLWFW